MIGPDRAATGAPASSPGAFVAHSEIRVTPQGTAALTAAFEDRLGEVEGWPGFHRLEVWADERDEGRFVMVSWWDDAAAFSAYLHSPSHQRSHDRIARGPDAPRPVSFARFRVVAR